MPKSSLLKDKGLPTKRNYKFISSHSFLQFLSQVRVKVYMEVFFTPPELHLQLSFLRPDPPPDIRPEKCVSGWQPLFFPAYFFELVFLVSLVKIGTYVFIHQQFSNRNSIRTYQIIHDEYILAKQGSVEKASSKVKASCSRQLVVFMVSCETSWKQPCSHILSSFPHCFRFQSVEISSHQIKRHEVLGHSL